LNFKKIIKYMTMILVFAFGLPAYGQIYKYVDAKGKVVYSDKPVPGSTGLATTTMTGLSSVAGGGNGLNANKSINDANSLPKTKWNPGHYLLIYPQGKEGDRLHARYMDEVIRDISINPGFQGIQKQYSWNKLEPAKGMYDFSQIRRDLDALAEVNKRLVISLQERSFINGEKLVPSYLLTPEYEGGVYSFNDGKGYNAIYWNDKVQDRLVALVTEMGKQLDGHPNLEAINFEETSNGIKAKDPREKFTNSYYAGVVRVALAAKKAFPSTVVIQYINYAAWSLDKVVNQLVAAGVGVGGPDVSEKDLHLAKASYPYFTKVSGTVPIGVAVQWWNYETNNGEKTGAKPSIASIHAFAQNGLKANYIFWLRRSQDKKNGPDYFQNVLSHFKTINWSVDQYGGLDGKCPKALVNCTSK